MNVFALFGIYIQAELIGCGLFLAFCFIFFTFSTITAIVIPTTIIIIIIVIIIRARCRYWCWFSFLHSVRWFSFDGRLLLTLDTLLLPYILARMFNVWSKMLQKQIARHSDKILNGIFGAGATMSRLNNGRHYVLISINVEIIPSTCRIILSSSSSSFSPFHFGH